MNVRLPLWIALAAPLILAGEKKPANLLDGVKVPKDFSLTLFAAPPDVGYPTCLCCAPTGEVFVGVDENGSLDAKPDRGRVVKCIDTDGDGKADKFTVFAKMDSPRGLFFDNNTLFVLHPPNLTAYYDENGDGVSDRSEDLVTGIGFDLKFRGADHTTNGIQMGIDGWIYIAVGDYGFINAVGKDGKSLQCHGGGVARVRADGTELEMYTRGQRNIYDVAVDPLLNCFTRDNTNDGDGWDVRLSYLIQNGDYGYPRLYKNFADETVAPLADYGGGSPCGSLFIQEGMLPAEFGNTLYTCEWGNNAVFYHPLEPNGAGFKAQQKKFVEITRPTDMDVDGSGKIYIASWKGATFNYAGPNAGFVVRVTSNTTKAEAFPDLKKATDDELLKHLCSKSHVCRIHVQREILRRGAKPQFAEGLEKLAAAEGDPGVRVAAVFSLKQLLGARANDALVRLSRVDAIREFALRALADRKTEITGVAASPFIDSLSDKNPRVRLAAVIGLDRLGKTETAAEIVKVLGDADALVTHLAIRTLIDLKGADVCLKALDETAPNVAANSLRALQGMHETRVVDALIARFGEEKDPAKKQLIVKALCRLHFKESDWDKKWWTTRPDSSGPYFKWTAWDQTDKIARTLKEILATADAETARTLVVAMRRHKIESPEATAMLVKLANDDPAFAATAVSLLSSGNVPAEAAAALEKIAVSPKENPNVRAKAFSALKKIGGKPETLDACIRVLAAWNALEKTPGELARASEDFVRDGKYAQNSAYFVKLANDADSAKAQIAFRVLLHVLDNKGTKKEVSDEISKAITEAWNKPNVTALLRAVGQGKCDKYKNEVFVKLADAKPEIAQAAAYAAKELKLDKAGPQTLKQATPPLIEKLEPEKVLAEVMKEKGDSKLGEQLFTKQNCINCHTVSSREAPKGPFLGDIATRYNRAELAESILKPSAKIAQGFQTHWYKTKDGLRQEGFVVRESGTEVELRNATATSIVIKKDDIAKSGTLELSVMPEGLMNNASVQDFASMLDYLQSLKTK